jgi:hypothetical protein
VLAAYMAGIYRLHVYHLEHIISLIMHLGTQQ